MKKFYTVEVQVDTLEQLNNVKGYAGRKVFVTANNSFYFWDETLGKWSSEYGFGYKYYRCQLFQTTTNNPYDNVLGTFTLSDNIMWERLEQGVYRGTLTDAFPEFLTSINYNSLVFLPASTIASPGNDAAIYYINIERVDNDTIMLTKVDNGFNLIDGLDSFELEIKVFDEHSLND